MYYAFRPRNDHEAGIAEKLLKSLIYGWYFILNKTLRTLASWLFSSPGNLKIQRILVLRMGGLGDTITALPAFAAIREQYPLASLDLLTNEPQKLRNTIAEIAPENTFSTIFYYHKFVDQPLVKILKKKKYDLFIELPSYDASVFFEVRSLWFARRIGAKKGMGWHISSSRLLKEKQEKWFLFDTNATRLQEILLYYGLRFRKKSNLLASLAIPVPKVSQDYDPFFSTYRNVIAIIPGAGRSQNKWPLQYFKEVSQYFAEKNYGIIIIGGNQDFEEGQIIKDLTHGLNLCGKLTPLQNASVFRKCRLVITNDTGPMHIAYSVGTPVLAIFSARDYSGKWFPPDENHNKTLKNNDVPCATCFTFTCTNNICMQNIKPGTVIQSAENILAESGLNGVE